MPSRQPRIHTTGATLRLTMTRRPSAALLFAAVAAAALLVTGHRAEAQQVCGSDKSLCLGDATHRVKTKGDLLIDRQVVPTNSSGVVMVDGGVAISNGLAVNGGVDAGYALINGDLRVLGNLLLPASTTSGTCTLVDGSSLSSCTATVRAGSTCRCSPVGTTAAIAAGGCAVSLSSTTLTVTGPDNGNYVVNYICN